MKKITICCLLFCISFFATAQCTISPFIQQNYQFDAVTLALREITSDVNDPDYDNPFIPQARIDFHLEKLSALYENPNNIPEVDSIFNELQHHVHYSPAYKEFGFMVQTNASWVQPLKDTGISGISAIDNLISAYQFSMTSFSSYNSCQCTFFWFTTAYDFLNVNALKDDFEAIQDITSAGGGGPVGDLVNYSGIPYVIRVEWYPPGSFRSAYAEVSDISHDEQSGNYEFYLGGDDCFSGCILDRTWYANISDDCSQVTFSQTLSVEDTELPDVAIYPNPTSDNLQIKGITNIQQVEIYSILGTMIKIPLDASQNTLNVSSLKNGVYFLKVTDAQNRIAVRKFIKE